MTSNTQNRSLLTKRSDTSPTTPQRKDFMTLIQNQIKAKTRTRLRDKEKEWEGRQRWKVDLSLDIREVPVMTDRP